MSTLSYEELRVELAETKRKLELRELGIEDPDAELPKPPVIKTCNHIRENGKLCRSAAVTGRDYCYFHLSHRGRRLKMARARARGRRWRLELPPLEDLYAVQVGLQQVLDAMADGHLDRHLGGLMLYGLQQAATNLRCPQEVWEQSSRFDHVEQIEWSGFEQEHGLPEGFDVDTPPEEAFPPPEELPATLPDAAAVSCETPAPHSESAAAPKQPPAVARKASSLDQAGARTNPAARKSPQTEGRNRRKTATGAS